jgi:hypothetical protein
MRYQAQSFIKQVQIDLLALSDADLFHEIDQWVPRKEPSILSQDAQEVTRTALGYTRAPETEHLSRLPGVGPEVREQWLAPSPHHMRLLLTEMDVKQFAQHVIAIAFQSLHATHPEWGDGSTFNAHLANHLRGIRMNRRRNDQRTMRTPHV